MAAITERGERRTVLCFAAMLPPGGMVASVFKDLYKPFQLTIRNLIKNNMLIVDDESMVSLNPVCRTSMNLDTSFFEMHPFILSLYKYIQTVNDERNAFWYPKIDLSDDADHIAQIKEHLEKLTKQLVRTTEYAKVWDQASELVKECSAMDVLTQEQRDLAQELLKQIDYWYCFAETRDRLDRLYDARFEANRNAADTLLNMLHTLTDVPPYIQTQICFVLSIFYDESEGWTKELEVAYIYYDAAQNVPIPAWKQAYLLWNLAKAEENKYDRTEALSLGEFSKLLQERKGMTSNDPQ